MVTIEARNTIRLVLGLIFVINVPLVYGVVSEFAESTPFLLDAYFLFSSLFWSLGAIYLFWKLNTLLPRYQFAIIRIVWALFVADVFINLIDALLYWPSIAEFTHGTVVPPELIGIIVVFSGFYYLVCATLVHHINRCCAGRGEKYPPTTVLLLISILGVIVLIFIGVLPTLLTDTLTSFNLL